MAKRLQALIVGGGIGGMSAAIRLRTMGIAVDLIDKDPDWRVYGAGITVTGPTLRAFKQLGLLDEIKASGFCSAGARVFTPAGEQVGEMHIPALEPGIPGQGGIMRPVLHKILSTRTVELGTQVRLGISVVQIEDKHGNAVSVRFTDGSAGNYDLVIGADGVNSHLRSLLFPNAAKPRFSGQGCWRVIAPRPPEVDRAEFYLGGPHKVGLNPCSQTQMYMFLLDSKTGKAHIDPADQQRVLYGLMEGYGGRIATIRANLDADSSINYRPLEPVLQSRPWHCGRTLLIGDAAHATTPHLASGAGMAVEDALVLGEALGNHQSLDAAFDAFTQRRWERCRLIVTNSIRLGELEMAGSLPEEQQRLMEESIAALAAPI